MSWQTLLDPPVLFFALGLVSVFVRSDLKIPYALTKFLSLYLLMSIGFKGGVSLSKTGFHSQFIAALVGGLLISALTPVVLFHLTKKRLGAATAAAVGSTYGSVSAVTFVAATTWLENRGFAFDGSMIAVLALMEAPAIVLGLLLARRESAARDQASMGGILHESLFNGSVFLLLGSLLIGWISGPSGNESIGVFVVDLFKGLLGFFLLDLGIKSGQALRSSRVPRWLVPVGIVVPVLNAGLALFWSRISGIEPSQAFLLMSLAAGASYIAVPAALKHALPQADSGVYLTLALGVTFPLNILIGLPIYWEWVRWAYVP